MENNLLYDFQKENVNRVENLFQRRDQFLLNNKIMRFELIFVEILDLKEVVHEVIVVYEEVKMVMVL